MAEKIFKWREEGPRYFSASFKLEDFPALLIKVLFRRRDTHPNDILRNDTQHGNEKGHAATTLCRVSLCRVSLMLSFTF
jgi:hypothetical protein